MTCGKISFFSKKRAVAKAAILFSLFLFSINSDALALKSKMLKLPHPTIPAEKGIEQLLKSRYSCRNFSPRRLNLDQVAILLWATAGKISDAITSATTRTTPSAGATYPLQLYVVAGKEAVDGLPQGLYRYSIEQHALEVVIENRDIRKELSGACLGQRFIEDAPISLVVAARFERTTNRYGQRGISYVYSEAGSACQNIYLMAANLGLGTVQVGAFHDQNLKKLLLLTDNTEPISIMPVGYAR